MNSPFYEAEQRNLYPNRDNMIKTKEELAAHLIEIIGKGLETKETLHIKPLKDIILHYANNCDAFTVTKAIELLLDDKNS